MKDVFEYYLNNYLSVMSKSQLMDVYISFGNLYPESETTDILAEVKIHILSIFLEYCLSSING